jgi:hypothetical protein
VEFAVQDPEMLVEGQREITIKLLREGGLLGQGSACDMIWSWPMDHGERGFFYARASWRPDVRVLGVWPIAKPFADDLRSPLQATPEPPRTAIMVRLDHRQTQKGEQWAFICPLTRVRCRSLFWIDDIIASRGALGLKYHKERDLDRRFRQFQGVERTKMLRLEPKILSVAPSVTEVMGRSLNPERERSMSQAIERGSEIPTPAAELRRAALDAHGANFVQALQVQTPEAPQDAQTALYELAPLIDVLTLRERGLLNPGQFTHVLLRWEGRQPVIASLSIDLRKPKTPHLLIETRVRDERPGAPKRLIHHIALQDRGAKADRWRMICPATGLEVKALAFRFDRWASKEAQRLVYRSQRSQRFRYYDSRGYREMPRRSRTTKGED